MSEVYKNITRFLTSSKILIVITLEIKRSDLKPGEFYYSERFRVTDSQQVYLALQEWQNKLHLTILNMRNVDVLKGFTTLIFDKFGTCLHCWESTAEMENDLGHYDLLRFFDRECSSLAYPLKIISYIKFPRTGPGFNFVTSNPINDNKVIPSDQKRNNEVMPRTDPVFYFGRSNPINDNKVIPSDQKRNNEVMRRTDPVFSFRRSNLINDNKVIPSDHKINNKVMPRTDPGFFFGTFNPINDNVIPSYHKRNNEVMPRTDPVFYFGASNPINDNKVIPSDHKRNNEVMPRTDPVIFKFGISNSISDDKVMPSVSIKDDFLLECLTGLSTDLKKKLLDQAVGADVTLHVDDAKIKVHKMILRARSPVFDRMFDYDTSEATKNVIDIKDIRASVMKELLLFLYTGTKKNLDFETALELYYAADKYEMLSLREGCKKDLLCHFRVENACQVLLLANRHGDEPFKEEVMKFIEANFKVIVDTESFNELAKSDVDIALLLMRKHVQS